MMPGDVLDDARQFAISRFGGAAFEIEQLHDDTLRRVWFAGILRRRKQSRHPLHAELSQPAGDGRVGKIELACLLRRGDFPGQTRRDCVVTLLGRAGDGDFIKTQSELNRHQALIAGRS